jgi:hypothetical protein
MQHGSIELLVFILATMLYLLESNFLLLDSVKRSRFMLFGSSSKLTIPFDLIIVCFFCLLVLANEQ